MIKAYLLGFTGFLNPHKKYFVAYDRPGKIDILPINKHAFNLLKIAFQRYNYETMK